MLEDAALGAKSSHQGVDLKGGVTADVGPHDHGVEGLVHPAAGLEHLGAGRTFPQALAPLPPFLGGELGELLSAGA